jgi:DNA-binding transcriptional ArsR family regulator
MGASARKVRTGVRTDVRTDVLTGVLPKVRTVVHAKGPAIATNLDRLLHDRMRLGIVSALAAGEQMSFTDLKTALDATDGNLSVHARKLEEAGYVACEKTFAGRTPRTDYRLTAAGRRALEKYLDHMAAIIKASRS